MPMDSQTSRQAPEYINLTGSFNTMFPPVGWSEDDAQRIAFMDEAWGLCL